MSRMCVAIDAEFLKTLGDVYARSVAFVPFSSTGTATVGTLVPRTTLYPATILSLSAEETMRRADLLPCGHTLVGEVATLLSHNRRAIGRVKHRYINSSGGGGEVDVKSLLLPYYKQSRVDQEREKEETIRKSMAGTASEKHESRFTRLRERKPELFEPKVKQATKAKKVSSASGQSPNALSAALAMDHYSLPNPRRVDHGLLAAVYTEDYKSPPFASAAKELGALKKYGGGKKERPSLLFLLRHHPAFLQAALRERFENEDAWLKWLDRCASVSLMELQRVNAEHRQRTLDGSVESYTECASMVEFSECLSRTWSRFLSRNQCRFYCYSSGDLPAVRQTLSITCGRKPINASSPLGRSQTESIPAAVKQDETKSNMNSQSTAGKENSSRNSSTDTRFSLRAKSAGRSKKKPSSSSSCSSGGSTTTATPSMTMTPTKPNGPVSETNSSNNNNSTSRNGGGIAPVDSNRLVSPFQATMTDVTEHPLFLASGFQLAPKMTPPLRSALGRSAAVDKTAERIHLAAKPHDPEWDAQALACVCICSGIVK